MCRLNKIVMIGLINTLRNFLRNLDLLFVFILILISLWLDCRLSSCFITMGKSSFLRLIIKNKGFKVDIIPKVVDNSKLNNFQYVDSGIKLGDLIDSTDLNAYRKDSFVWIDKQLTSLLEKYQL